MSNGKVMIIHPIVKLIKKILYKMSQYFPKPQKKFGGKVKVALYLSSYATKNKFKNVTKMDISNLSSKDNLASFKAEIDVDKLKTVTIDLSKLSNVVKK